MPKQKKISIVTPSFNQGEYIEQTIDSVLSQNYSNIEYIIIDGGSADKTVEIIKKYEKHLKYWVSEPDRGQSHAINKGLKHVTGDIFNWINSDDYYEPDAFKIIEEHFLSNPDLEILAGREKRHKGSKVYLSDGSTIRKDLKDTILKAHIVQPPTFWKAKIFKNLQGLTETYNYLMDSEIWVRYLLQYGQNNIKKVDDIFVNFRIHAESKTSQYQDMFNEERVNLVLSIAKTIDISHEIRRKFIEVFNSSDPNKLNLQRAIHSQGLKGDLTFFFVDMFFSSYYFNHDFSTCRKILIDSFSSHKIDINFIKLLIGLFFVPDSVLKRLIKRRESFFNVSKILEY